MLKIHLLILIKVKSILGFNPDTEIEKGLESLLLGLKITKNNYFDTFVSIQNKAYYKLFL